MHIGEITLIAPVIYLIMAAIVVLILGVIAARRPDKGLDHYLPTQYLALALMVPGVLMAARLIPVSLFLNSQSVTTGLSKFPTPAVNLFVTAGGHAQLAVDPFAAIVSFVAFAGTLIVMLISLDHFGERQIHKAEYYSLLMFACAAASLAAAASDLIAIYLSIEFLSLTSYVLAAFAKTDRRSGEAGLKYFLYGSACSGIMLYGMSILFGATGGSTALSAIAGGFTGGWASGAAFVGVMFTLVGLGFKIALVPFQFWAPDVYEGAPTPVTAFLSVVSKAAGLAVIVRFLTVVATPAAAPGLSWYWVLVVLTALSMFYGNLVAIPQRNIKRMLAYSSIAQVGYMMVGVLAAMNVFTRDSAVAGASASVSSSQVSWGMQGVLIYIVAYLLMNLGAFAVVVAVGKRLNSNAVDAYAGLAKISPLAAAALTVFLASLAGLPPLIGFLGKFYVFGGAISVGLAGRPELIALAVVGVVNSVISVFYYFNVVRLMYFAEPDEERPFVFGRAMTAVVAVMLFLTVALVVAFQPLSDLSLRAVHLGLR